MVTAQKGLPLAPLERRILRAAWITRARQFNPPQWSPTSRLSGVLRRAMTRLAAFQHNAYMTTLAMPRVVALERGVVLGETFEGQIFDKLWPKSPIPTTAADLHRDHSMAQPAPKPEKKRVKDVDGTTLARQDMSLRPWLKPLLAPSFSESGGGDDS